MATTNKDFRVKNGLVVEGSTSTVNGNQVLTTASSLDSLSDVVITTPSTSQVLSYNGTNWVNSSSGGGGTTTNALTIGTGLSGTSFNGSAAVTIAIDSTVTTLTGTQELSNKTLTSPTLTTPSIGVATGTSFNSITGLSSTTPVVDGTAAVGTATTVARADHVHPTPTSVVATVSGTNSADLVYGHMADNDQFRIRVGGTATNAGFVEIATADDGTEPIYVRQYTGVFTTLARTATLLDGSGNTTFPGTVSASGLAGSLLTSTVGTNIGTASAGTSAIPARSDHVHPTTGLGLTASGLNQFAATTSAQLAGVISDETGSGALVFGTSPAITTSLTTPSTTFALINTTATTVNFAGAATTLSVGASSGTTTVNNNLAITGNLTVNGTTTTVNSTTTTVDDPIMTLGGDTAPATDDNKDRGIEFRWHNGTAAKVGFFGYDDSSGRLTFIPDATNTSEVFSGTQGDIDVNNIYINGTAATGTGGVVRATSPTLVTPALGVATATSINGTSIPSSATLYSSGGTDVTLADGGTNASLTAANGGVVYSTASAMAITSAGTSGQALVSAGAAAPVWTTLGLDNLPGAWTKKSVRVATTAALGGTYANGTAGVGATLTITSTATLDGVTLANNDRILVKDQATTFQNGIYTRTSATVLTRVADADSPGEVSAAIVGVDEGTANGGSAYTNYFKATDTIGTTAIVWSKVVDTSQFGTGIATFLATPTSANLAAAITNETGSGALVFATSPTLVTPSIGVATGTSFNSITGLSSTTPAALGTAAVGTGTTVARADHVHPTTGLALLSGAAFTGTVTIPNIDWGYTTTVTAAGTTTLTVSSTYLQHFSGTTTQTIVLPVTSTLSTGHSYEIVNNSTGNLTINSSGGNLVATAIPGTSMAVTCVGTGLTTAANWDAEINGFNTITGTGAGVFGTAPTISNLVLSGTLTAGGATGTSGQLLASTGSGVQWKTVSAPASGDQFLLMGA